MPRSETRQALTKGTVRLCLQGRRAGNGARLDGALEDETGVLLLLLQQCGGDVDTMLRVHDTYLQVRA